MILRIKLWLVGAGAFIAALLAAWFSGKRSAGRTDLENYRETRKRMDEADHAGDAREWLRDRGQR
jgi:hypothetical protein